MFTADEVRHPGADVLAQVLAKFPTQTAQALRRLGRVQRWREGEYILHGGVVASSVVLLLSGRARMVVTTAEGEEVFFRWFVPGEFVGVASVLGQVPSATHAIASGKVEAVQVDAAELRRHLATDGEGALEFARRVSHFASELVQLMAAFITSGVEKRIVILLARLVARQSGPRSGGGVRLTLSHQDVADAVGASRQRVSVELGKLAEKGLIRLGYRHVVVLQPLSEPIPGLTESDGRSPSSR